MSPRVPTPRDLLSDHALVSLALPAGFTRADGEPIYETMGRGNRIFTYIIGIMTTLVVVFNTDWVLMKPGPANLWMGGCHYVVASDEYCEAAVFEQTCVPKNCVSGPNALCRGHFSVDKGHYIGDHGKDWRTKFTAEEMKDWTYNYGKGGCAIYIGHKETSPWDCSFGWNTMNEEGGMKVEKNSGQILHPQCRTKRSDEGVVGLIPVDTVGGCGQVTDKTSPQYCWATTRQMCGCDLDWKKGCKFPKCLPSAGKDPTVGDKTNLDAAMLAEFIDFYVTGPPRSMTTHMKGCFCEFSAGKATGRSDGWRSKDCNCDPAQGKVTGCADVPYQDVCSVLGGDGYVNRGPGQHGEWPVNATNDEMGIEIALGGTSLTIAQTVVAMVYGASRL